MASKKALNAENLKSLGAKRLFEWAKTQKGK